MSIAGSAILDHLEGHIRVTLWPQDDRVGRVEIASSRPQLAQRLLAGHTAEQAAERVGRLYTVCGRAQRLAAQAAAEAAAGETVPATRLARRELEVLTEQAREHVWQLLLPTTGAVGATAAPTALRRIVQAGEEAYALATTLTHVLTEQLLGEPPARWLSRDPDDLRRWCAAAATAPALRLAQLLEDPDPAVCHTPLLPALAAWRPDSIRSLALQALGEPGFCARPLWLDRPAETGVLSRLWHDPTLSAWIGAMGRGSAARLLARLVELARLPTRLLEGGLPVVRAWPLGEGIGAAGVETARGLLLHVVRLAAGRVTDYRILAPTEWNFHPAGPLAEALAAMPTGADLSERARRVVTSLDPCVACQVEVRHA
jgi:hypothetical protein